MRLQTLDVKQSKTGWAKEAGRISAAGDTYYFVGCAPFFDVEFRDDWGLDALEGPRGVIKLLNAVGVEPVVHDDERCCGHDLMWNGDMASFKLLARRNVDLIKSLGCKRVVFHCPEGYVTFKKYYPEVVGPLEFEVVHFYELLADRLKDGGVSLGLPDGVITYHDPCRLARQADIMDSPRALLRSIEGVTLKEMAHNRENALCCGTSGWMQCSSCSKEMQRTRLSEALAVGAGTLVTACPKCRLHLSCALRDMEVDLKIRDINELLAAALRS
jgi:Fe-S oxidoreductase